MIVAIKTDKLKIGMFIDMSNSWVKNPFWETKFMLRTDEQITKIRDSGVCEVNVDVSKSSIEMSGLKDMGDVQKRGEDNQFFTYKQEREYETDKVPVNRNEKSANSNGDSQIIQKPAIKWEPQTFISGKLLEAVKNKRLEPGIRAKAVYHYSLQIMKNIFEKPSYEVIAASCFGISEIVEIIMSEPHTSVELVKTVSYDSYEYTHAVNVGIKSLLLAKSLFAKSGSHNIREMGVGFFLHDIGKIQISQAIRNKEGKLTAEEMKIMQSHPFLGYKILSKMNLIDTEVLIIAMQHHERDNGTGYPSALKGKAIHPYARICCIADVFDALTAKRSYNNQKSLMEALTIMKGEMLVFFNKNIFKEFILLFTKK